MVGLILLVIHLYIMSMTPLNILKEQAVSLGLQGEEVGKFVLHQQALERDERAAERAAQMEAEERAAQKEERAAQREAAERDAQREAAEREAQLAMAKLTADKELELARLAAQGRSERASPDNHVSKPCLPQYQEGEDIASYLVRFERVAELLNVDEESYAIRLGSLLTGKAADIYISLSSEITKSYPSLKQALLTAFHKTPDGYRAEFRGAKVKSGESYQQFSTQLTRLFQAWLETSGVDAAYDSLKDFMILDQFLASLAPELRLFVKERLPKTLAEATQLADNWASAHNSYSKYRFDPSGKKYKSTPSSPKPPPKASPVVKCHQCGEEGHIRPRCPKNPRAFKDGTTTPRHEVRFCWEAPRVPNYRVSGTINGSWTSFIIRDTGCSCIVVAEDVLPDADVTHCRKVYLSDYLGRTDAFPVVRCYLRCPYFVGWADAVRAPIKFASVLIGNVPGARDPNDPDDCSAVSPSSSSCPAHVTPRKDSTPPAGITSTNLDDDIPSTSESTIQQACAVQTRSSKIKRQHPLVLPALQPFGITPDDFGKLQASCSTLATVRSKVSSGLVDKVRNGTSFQYVKDNGLLYRKCLKSNRPDKVGQLALVVPHKCRQTVLSVAHESPLAGHFSHRKTEMKITDHFYWPGMGADIRSFCRSCDKCQRFSAKGRVRPAPLKPMPVITEPFSRVAIDLVGPLSPPSSDGHRYILTLIDFATGFPEAVPLKDIDSISVSEALLSIFSRVGIPREILSDRGTQFTSHLMAELHKLLGVKPIFTTPFHPSGNGRIERLHGPLKACLRKLCEEKPREWHRYLIPTLFALRELPSDRTGFSAFDLLYGRAVRGPLTALRDLWEDQHIQGEERSSFQYILELREKLAECSKLAAQNAEISRSKYKAYFDVRSQDRQFKPGDEVLVLLPNETSKLLISWNGPYKVLERRGKVDYVIDEPKGPKMYHVNLLKRYYRREQVLQAAVLDEEPTLQSLSSPDDQQEMPSVPDDEEFSHHLPLTPDGQTNDQREKPEIGTSLTPLQQADLQKLMCEFQTTFSNFPGCTDTIEHDIVLTTTDRVQFKNYPVPVHLKPSFEKEVETLLEQGIIQHSSSPHCSPVVMVKKSDGTYRMAIDYRQLNAITVFHAEPTCNKEEDLHKFSGSKYFSELDLSKAYYQVPLSDHARPLTAFPTHLGLMEFCRMPFGLVTACATYIHLMRIVLAGLANVSFYFDNIFIYSKDWPSHLEAIRSVLTRLREHHLTIKPSKCRFGVESVQYLGFWVNGTNFWPLEDKLLAINNMNPPTSKKLLRSFLGFVSFYRIFIPQASDYTGPLSDLLRKDTKEPLPWSDDLLRCFLHLKSALSSTPVLRIPDPQQTFVLRTDASNHGLGAVLLQYHDEYPHPVCYASRKLLDREKRYSTIERECLAIVFGIVKFDLYLRGKEFILEIDHRPLIYLNTFKGRNDRLLRWSLSIQSYSFRIVHISGKDNVGADLLSRNL